jgi:hypothetical protein
MATVLQFESADWPLLVVSNRAFHTLNTRPAGHHHTVEDETLRC